MIGAYIMLFAMIFLGIMGAVNVILFIGSLGTPHAPPVFVTPDGCDDVEGKVRTALKVTDGKVIINVSKKLENDSEFKEICCALAADCPRVILRTGKTENKDK